MPASLPIKRNVRSFWPAEWPLNWPMLSDSEMLEKIQATVWPEEPWGHRRVWAQVLHRPLLVKALLEKGIDPNAKWCWSDVESLKKDNMTLPSHVRRVGRNVTRSVLEHALILGDVEVIQALLEHGAAVPHNWLATVLARPVGRSSAEHWTASVQDIVDVMMPHVDAQSMPSNLDWIKIVIDGIEKNVGVQPLMWVAQQAALDWNAVVVVGDHSVVQRSTQEMTVLAAMLRKNPSLVLVREALKLGAQALPEAHRSPLAWFVEHRPASDFRTPHAKQKALALAEALNDHGALRETAWTQEVFKNVQREAWWSDLQQAWRAGRTPGAWWALIRSRPTSPSALDRLDTWLRQDPDMALWENEKNQRAFEMLLNMESPRTRRKKGATIDDMPWSALTRLWQEELTATPLHNLSLLLARIKDTTTIARLFESTPYEHRERILLGLIKNAYGVSGPESLDVWLRLGLEHWPRTIVGLLSLGPATIVQHAINANMPAAVEIALKAGLPCNENDLAEARRRQANQSSQRWDVAIVELERQELKRSAHEWPHGRLPSSSLLKARL